LPTPAARRRAASRFILAFALWPFSGLAAPTNGRNANTGKSMGGILVAITVGITAIVLFAGLAVMAIGGDTAKEWSNRLMRYRILAQMLAVLVILAVLLARGH
jgi:lipopolysaccharide export LptBFGC system permease protein LptF